MDNNINIRLAEEKDKDKCLEFERFSNEKYLMEWINKGRVILAEKEGKEIGYIRYRYFWEGLPYLCLIKIKEDFRANGIGTIMLKYLEDHLKKDGNDRLLSSTDANEPKPQHWHRKAGFEEAGFIKEMNDNRVGELFFLKDL